MASLTFAPDSCNGQFCGALAMRGQRPSLRAGAGTRYVFTALHRDEADFEKDKTSGCQQGTEIALDQSVAHVKSLK